MSIRFRLPSTFMIQRELSHESFIRSIQRRV